MLRLILLRHARAEKNHIEGDHERILVESGQEDAVGLGRWLEQNFVLPDHILVSSAVRTVETFRCMAQSSRSIAVLEPVISKGLYNASADMILHAIHSCVQSGNCVMVIGHNPGIADLALRLPGFGDRYARVEMTQNFPPAALAVIDFDVDDWDEISEHNGRLDAFITPIRYRSSFSGSE